MPNTTGLQGLGPRSQSLERMLVLIKQLGCKINHAFLWQLIIININSTIIIIIFITLSSFNAPGPVPFFLVFSI